MRTKASLTIYFNAAICAENEFEQEYRLIVETLEKLGHKVISDHVFQQTLEDLKKKKPEQLQKYYHQTKRKIQKADLMVAEISYPSTVNVGHELTLALEYNKPVLALYRTDQPPLIFWALNEDKFCVAEYSLSNLPTVIQDCLDYLSSQVDSRFNFFISPRLQNYLDLIFKKKKIPRSVYLRRLIEEDMAKNKDLVD
ncbi:MAG TPA: hypothetical protein VD999_03625 [Vitreimonas sp.]|nr:hypothetical protein [Vitreimonas sp.]